MTTISTLPPAPQPTDTTTDFNTKAFALLNALDEFVTETNLVAGEVQDAATTAIAAASSAAAVAGAVAWVSGATYAIGDARYSLIDFQTYRRTTAGAGTTDPSADGANWTLAFDLSSKQDISAKDATGGYAGLTLFKINFKNALNTFTSFFTNANTAARTYTFQDKTGTIAHTSDVLDSTAKTTPVDADIVGILDSAAGNVLKQVTLANIKAAWKDATGGLVGMTLFKINFKNAANTFTSFFTNSNTAARTYTFQDRDGTIDHVLDVVLNSTTAVTMVSNAHYINTNVALTTATLPSSASTGDIIWVSFTNSLLTNVIARNGLTIMGSATDMTVNVQYYTVKLRYVNSTWSLV